MVAPFVLARGLRLVAEWRDLSIPTLLFGIGTIAVGIVGGALGPGAASLLAAVVWFAWITILAIRMRRLSRETGTLETG